MATRSAAAKTATAKRPLPPLAHRSPRPCPKAKPVAPVVTLKAVFEQLGEIHALPKKQAHSLLADFVAAMTKHLTQGIGSA